ncbi:MAG: diacylglycerol kinase family lipid kinase [Bacteroidales bacterium]|nr:diacylglycerol kinase family lipid kinase [Bacteroidales bacterium]MCF8403496.1 diacylglycerol kinase family lipid kinase [Bacteroidales bacterium]
MPELKIKITAEWLVIVNPNAGTRKGEKDWHTISGLLHQSGIQYKEIFTTHKEHAIAITTRFIKKGYRNFIVVGGDGTLNEVVNGIFFQKNIPTEDFLLAMVPVGTGNDWCRMFNIPFKYREAIDLIVKKEVFTQDIGRVNYFNSGSPKRRYFINVAGMGYDAVVAAKTNKDKEHGRGGPLVYLKNLFTSLLFYKHTNTEITVNQGKDTCNCQTFSLSVGICKYNGGGMKQLPDAIPNDGLFNMTLIKKLGKFTVLKEVKNLFDGSFINHPKVKTFTGDHFKITSTPEIMLEADGESLGHSPFEFEIIPKSLQVVVGEEWHK